MIDRETVIRLAREAVNSGDGSELSGDAIERFAQLVFLEAAAPFGFEPDDHEYEDLGLPPEDEARSVMQQAANGVTPCARTHDIEAIHKAWHTVGADTAGLKWADFIRALGVPVLPGGQQHE